MIYDKCEDCSVDSHTERDVCRACQLDDALKTIDKLEQQLAERDAEIARLNTITEMCGIKDLQTENAALRAEVERLKSPLVDAPAAYENGRKQAAQEIIEEVIGDWNCDCGYGGLVIADAIKARFGLEG